MNNNRDPVYRWYGDRFMSEDAHFNEVLNEGFAELIFWLFKQILKLAGLLIPVILGFAATFYWGISGWITVPIGIALGVVLNRIFKVIAIILLIIAFIIYIIISL